MNEITVILTCGLKNQIISSLSQSKCLAKFEEILSTHLWELNAITDALPCLTAEVWQEKTFQHSTILAVLLFVALSLVLIPVVVEHVVLTIMRCRSSRCRNKGNGGLYLSTNGCKPAPSQPHSVMASLGKVGGKPLRGKAGVCVGGRCRLSETRIVVRARDEQYLLLWHVANST